MQVTHHFDFQSPYPIEDCVNMLLAYTPPRKYETRWGRGMGVKLDDKILVKVFMQDEHTYQIEITPRPRHSMIQASIQATGTLQADDDGTHIMGSAINRVTAQMGMLVILILGLGIGAIFWGMWLVIIITGIVFAIVAVDMLQTMYLVSRYAQDLLEPKGARKKFSESDE